MKPSLLRLVRSPWALVVLAAACLTFFSASELPPVGVETNDFALHVSLARGVQQNLTLDFWHPVDLGYPILRVYQPLYHAALAALDAATFFHFGLSWWGTVSLILLGLAFPPGFFLGIRRWLRAEGLPEAEASWTAAVCALLSVFAVSFTGFGFAPLQGLTATFGVVTQAWAMVFFAPAFARATAFVLGRERSPWPAFGLGFVVCSMSLIVGVMLIACVALRGLFALGGGKPRATLLSLAVLLIGTVVLTAGLWWPMVRDVPWVYNPKSLFAAWVHQGFGVEGAFRALLSGTLLDGRTVDLLARPPAMTLLFAGSAIWCLVRRRERPQLSLFLFVGLALWFSFFVGREFWGGVLYALPLLRSYQWGRFETLIQLWAVVIAAMGCVGAARWAWTSPHRFLRPVSVAVGGVLVVALASAPFSIAAQNRQYLDAARKSQAAAHVQEIVSRLAGDPTRVYVGGPSTWEKQLKEGEIWLGVAVVGGGAQAVGRMYQGMPIASAMMFAWDGTGEWGADLLGVGNWLVPCAVPAGVSILPPAREIAPGICLALANHAPPLAFFTHIAAAAPVAIDEERVLALQKTMLGRPGEDLFLPYRPVAGSPGALPDRSAPLARVRVTGQAFTRTAPGRAESQVTLDAPDTGALVFPIPFHPRLEASVDGTSARPFPVVPGYAAVRVPAGRHDVGIVYRTDRVKDVLLVLALVVIGAGLLRPGLLKFPLPEPGTPPVPPSVQRKGRRAR